MRKAQVSGDVLAWIPKIILLVAVILVVLFLVRLYIVTKIDIKDAEAIVLVNRIMFSPHGFSYYDEKINRVYPGVIDLEKFNDSILEKIAYLPENLLISAKLTLTDMDKNPIKTIYYNKPWYDNWLPMAGISGPGGKTKITKTYYVLLKQGDEIKQAVLKFEVLMPNT